MQVGDLTIRNEAHGRLVTIMRHESNLSDDPSTTSSRNTIAKELEELADYVRRISE